MKPQYYTNTGNLTSPGKGLMYRLARAGIASFGLIALLLLMATSSASAASVDFQAGHVRVTVPILSGNVTAITNRVWITNTVAPVVFSVSGLPAGATYALTETNGTTPLLSAGNGLWDLLLTLYTTNVAEGVYDFTLNGTGGATKQLNLKLQAAHIWNGANGALNSPTLVWSQATNWLGGVPTYGSDIVFTDIGAQTNVYGTGKSFTNSVIDSSLTIGSLRFSQTGYTNSFATDTNTPPRFHNILLNAGVTLTLTNTEGFSILRDYIDDFYANNGVEGDTYGTMSVEISGPATSALVITNDAANFAILGSGQIAPQLIVSNLATMKAYVNRFALSEYQAYPNYANYNDDNSYGHFPRRFVNNFYMAKTNIIRASFIPPGGYANENTRQYAFSFMDSETAGSGSSFNNFLLFGLTNQIFADSVCLVGANHATGNGGAIRFGAPNSGALFRNTDGVSRMTIFSMGDDGGSTNRASSNVKAVVDFQHTAGTVNMLVDEFYMSRDRAMIASNDNPTAESTLTMGKGIIDANKAFLGYQEHDSKTDWTSAPYDAQVYRGYCRGNLIVSNTGTFKVNGNLVLGYTSDTNPASSAQQYMTVGQITVYSNSTVQASNIVVDGGLNFYDGINARNNNISLLGGTLIVTNSLGSPDQTNAAGVPNLPLDNLTLSAGTIWLNADANRTNVYVRNLISTVYASTVKIMSVSKRDFVPEADCAHFLSVGGSLPDGRRRPPGRGLLRVHPGQRREQHDRRVHHDQRAEHADLERPGRRQLESHHQELGDGRRRLPDELRAG